MLKWLLVIVLIVVVSGLMGSHPRRRFRLGHLPGDLWFTLRGRAFHFPFTSTLLLSLLGWLLLRRL